MTDALLGNAAWIVLASVAFMHVIVGVFAHRAWKQWRRLRVVRNAASALIAVHAERVDEAIVLVGRRSGSLADRGEGLAALLAELRTDIEHLRWLLDLVPSEREALERALVDIVLPTGRTADRRDREHSHGA